MVNSNKPATSKTSKGKVSIYVEKGRIKARLPRQYFGGEQPRIALGMDAEAFLMLIFSLAFTLPKTGFQFFGYFP